MKARALMKAIRAKLLVGIPPSDGQAHRVAERFALAAAAGELARRALDLPWREGEAEDAATICFKAWREALGGDGPGELREALEALRTATERDGESRFRSLDVFVTGDAANGAPYVHPGPIREPSWLSLRRIRARIDLGLYPLPAGRRCCAESDGRKLSPRCWRIRGCWSPSPIQITDSQSVSMGARSTSMR